MRGSLVVGLATVVVGMGAELGPARACSVPACLDDVLPATGRTVPRSARGVFLAPGHWSYATAVPAGLELFDGAGAAVPFDVVPASPSGVWAVLWSSARTSTGTLVLRHPQSCASDDGRTYDTAITVGEGAPWPAALGRTAVSAPTVETYTELDFSDPACGPVSTLASVVRVALELDPSAEPWADALRVRLEVDGVARDEPSQRPRFPYLDFAIAYGPTRVHTVHQDCAAGGRTVQLAFVADAPGTTDVLRSDRVTVTLDCAAIPDGGVTPAPDAGAGPSEDASARPDAAPRTDAGLVGGDAGVTGDAGAGGLRDAGSVLAVDDGGEACGCTSVERRGGARAPGWWLGAVLLGAVLWGRARAHAGGVGVPPSPPSRDSRLRVSDASITPKR